MNRTLANRFNFKNENFIKVQEGPNIPKQFADLGADLALSSPQMGTLRPIELPID
jgi:hypothetical protein